MFHADSPLPRLLLVALLVVCAGTAPVAATPSAPHDDPANDSTRVVLTLVSGDGLVDHTGDTAYVWSGSGVTVNVTYQLEGSANRTKVCLIPESDGAGTCQPATTGPGFERTAFTDIEPPADADATTYNVRIVRQAGDATAGEQTGVLAEEALTLTPIDRTGDFDGDGLKNEEEARLHTRVADTDTDNDGLQDGPEVHEYNTNPLVSDSDDDGLRDAVEINRGTDPQLADTDSDNLTDGKEIALGTDPTTADTDGDGLRDGKEVELGTDPTTADTDGDGLDDELEVDLNTNPAGAWSPLGWGVLALVGGMVVVGHRVGEWDGDPDAGTTMPSDDSPPAPPSGPTQPSPPRSDRETVLALLEEHDGKLRQSNIVEETDWSKAKVSRLLARLDDNGDVTKIRLGRENVICLPGQEPEGSKPRTDR